MSAASSVSSAPSLPTGKKLASTLRQHADDLHGFPDCATIAAMFRTGDVTLILDRIVCGLLRAAALEARLDRLAARGRDLTLSPVRMPSSRKAPTAKHAAKPAAPGDNKPGGPGAGGAPRPRAHAR